VYLSDAQDQQLAVLELPLAEIVRRGFAAAEHERLGPPVTRRERQQATFAVPSWKPDVSAILAGQSDAAMDEYMNRWLERCPYCPAAARAGDLASARKVLTGHIASEHPGKPLRPGEDPVPPFAAFQPGRSLSAGEQQAAMGEARRRSFVAESLTVTAPGCSHPRPARDPRNPSRCRCGALNLPEPE
jgi:hypothetical protein